jgi:uncharacterized protein YjiS (DUF1127 family)
MQCNKFSDGPFRTMKCAAFLHVRTKEVMKMLTISTLKSNLRRWARVRNTIRELSQLTDRDLADLGISRSDIRFIAKKHAAAH